VSIDITNESSVAEAAARLADQGPYIIILVATGLLHDDKIAPEKTYRVLSQSTLQTYFTVNSIGPALVAKHFISLLPKTGRCVFAALSARVGSIADNRLGGWYGYRASKAALNMLIKTLAIEVGRTRPGAICVGLHPGTVDTNLSKHFQTSVAPERLFMADDAARQLVNVFGNLTPADSGGCFSWNGERILP
jgi:NAD(P)-dependent dehydrogenase (short-subunit alcohol dehydrogenase family)